MNPADKRWLRRGCGLLLLAVLHGFAVGVCSARWEGYNPYEKDESASSLYAIRAPDLFYHNVGLLEILVSNVGVIGNPGFVDSYGAGWKGGEYLYAAALWFGAIASDNLSYVSTGAYEFELRPSLDPIDTVYQSFEGATGGDRVGFSASGGDDDDDGEIDEDPLNGKDDDNDGEIDEDYAAISQQMFSCEYWDYTEEAIARYPQHRPLFIKILQRSFAWSTERANEFVGFEYEIKNEGFETLRDIYIGYFVDSDAGQKDAPSYWSDDGGELRSIDTTYVDRTIQYECLDQDGTRRDCSKQELHLDIAFMYDSPGSVPGGEEADDLPAGADGFFGGMFLGHTTDPLGERAPRSVEIHTCRFFSGSGTYPNGDPRNDFERYDLLAAGDKPRRPTSQPSDYRYLFSAGPFKELLPGEALEFQMAFVIGHQWKGLLDNAIMAQRIYNGRWRDTDEDKTTGCDGKETCLFIEPGGEPLMWNDPCDSLKPAVMIKNTECGPDDWVDNDCNCCTPLQGEKCEGWETLVRWVGTVAPPPPSLNTEDAQLKVWVEQDRRIRLEWDNASELVADPISGEMRFCGYRVWRVEGWDRPIGSTGPRPEEWQLVADLWAQVDTETEAGRLLLEKRGTDLAIGSQYDLGDFTNDYAAIVDTIPSPIEGDEDLWKYEIGRYFYTDSLGLKNGMLYFYDVTAYSCWIDTTGGELTYMELTSQAAAVEAEGVRPAWAAVSGSDWKASIMVVPNPWRGGAEWDLTPSSGDPTGSHLDFAGLPNQECNVRIYSLAGDLVQTLHHTGGTGTGTVRWNMISRNGQDITSGVYLFAVTCGGETEVGRFTVIR